jgi:molybdopterin converting factor small subunit
MIGLPNPYLILGAVVVCTSAYFYGHHKGWVGRDQEMQIEIAKKNAEARETEQKLAAQITETSTKLMEVNNVVNQKQSALDRAISAGRVRLPATSCVSAAPSATAPARDWAEARTQPDRPADTASDEEREVLRLIAQITADGDRAINQLNACIDSYAKVMEAINAKR